MWRSSYIVFSSTFQQKVTCVILGLHKRDTIQQTGMIYCLIGRADNTRFTYNMTCAVTIVYWNLK